MKQFYIYTRTLIIFQAGTNVYEGLAVLTLNAEKL